MRMNKLWIPIAAAGAKSFGNNNNILRILLALSSLVQTQGSRWMDWRRAAAAADGLAAKADINLQKSFWNDVKK